jgi:hypothetical protein
VPELVSIHLRSRNFQ